MDPAHGDPGPKTVALIAQENLRLTKLFRKRLRMFTIVLFSILIILSIAYFVAVMVLWQIWPKINGLTNMYSGFFGFATAAALNIFAGWSGIATFYASNPERLDPTRSTAVCMLLAAGVLFNIVFPTSALTPFDIDSRKRVLTIPLHDCVDLKKDLHDILLPECDHHAHVTLFLYVMFPLILLEMMALTSYGYLKTSQLEDISDYDSTLSVSLTRGGDDDDDDTGDRTIAVDALDTYTTIGNVNGGAVISQGQDSSRFDTNRRSSYGGDQSYWAQPPNSYSSSGPFVVKSRSTPFGSSNSRQNQYQ